MQKVRTTHRYARVRARVYARARAFRLFKGRRRKSSEADKTTSEVSEFTSDVVFALFAKGAPSREHRCYSCIRCVLNLC